MQEPRTINIGIISLFTLVTDVLSKFTLNLFYCRGQCYDGATNVSGHLSGLQKRINEIEPRALYVHCTAHTLNLIVQNAMMNVQKSRDFLFLVRSIIVFVRNSPKRQAIFNSLQVEHELISGSLRPFCPTRWCMRIVSLKTVLTNYSVLIEFLSNSKMKKMKMVLKQVDFINK